MKYRAYFKLKLTLLSPLSIGSSNSESTDRDVILDSRGKPVIPATAIAGVFRSLCHTKKEKEELFGEIDKYEYDEKTQKNKKVADFHKTELYFYDAELIETSSKSVRDSVALNEYKSAEKGAKFDFEIIETGAVFIGYVETRTETAANEFRDLLQAKIYLGSKNTRGYGCVGIEYQEKIFNPEESDADKWLDFDMFCDLPWKDKSWKNPDKTDNFITIKLSLKQNGGLSIRQYSTEPNEADSVPLVLHDGKKIENGTFEITPTPVIPGTSWSGIFRSHMTKLLNFGKNGLNDIFGFVDENSKKSAKSKIRFSESQIKNAVRKQLTRNAIDRFTNGTKDGALFTEVTVYNGTTEFEISLEKNICDDIKSALTATILDLHNGYVAVGGLTSVGRGLFEVIKINEKEKAEKIDWTYETVKEAMFGAKQNRD